MTTKIAINGFGRIGRNILRASVSNSSIEIVAINDLTDTKTLAHLLKYDSVHGAFPGEVLVDNDSIVVNGKKIKVSAERNPENLNWKELKVDVVFECTGFFTKRADAAKHLEAGAKRVVISAPSPDADATFVYGVNHETFDKDKDFVISNGSCTTNCLAPIAKVLDENFGIVKGFMTTIHSYTNDQSILDLPHKDLRRARAAALSMIPTSTGAAKAIGLVLPKLNGKLDGMAIRVPTPNVSVVDLVCEVEKETDKKAVNLALSNAANASLKGVLAVSDEPLVSSDYNGSPASSTVDGLSTLVQGNMVKVLSWYDNEMGFSHRMIDLVKYISK